MDFIYPETAEELFERVETTIEEPGLQAEDRIRRFRIILEDLFRSLTSDVPIQFADLFARSVYVFEAYKTPKEVADEIHGLRSFANPAHHQWKVDLKPSDELTALRALCEAVSHFARKSTPEHLAKRYANHLERFSQRRKYITVRETYEFRAVVLSIIKTDPSRGAKYCTLICETDDFGTILLKFWNNKDESGFGSDLSSVADVAFPYSTIFVTGVRKRPDHENDFFATERSMFVLEPDYLIEVKDIADSRQRDRMNENIQLLNRFIPSIVSDKILLGILTGSVLDDLAAEGSNYNYKQTFSRFMNANSLNLLALATKESVYDREDVLKIYAAAHKHEATIRHVITPFLHDRKFSLEPTFFSARYGIHGRLDAMLEHNTHSDSKDILELKSSGTIPKSGVWPNHEAQALLYNLLLESVWPERRGLSSILYSGAQPMEMPLRNVNEEKTYLRQDLLMLRNRIVANEFRLAAGDASLLENLSPENAGTIPRYSEGALSEFSDVLKKASLLERDYFLEYCCFIFRELKIAKIGSDDPKDEENLGFSALWRRDKSEKREHHSVLVDLRIKRIEPGLHVFLEYPARPELFSDNHVANLRKGDIIVFYPTPDTEKLEPLNFQILKGTIENMDFDGLQISLANKELNPEYFKQSSFWALERDFRESSYKSMFRSMFEFLKADERMRSLLLGLKCPEFLPNYKNTQPKTQSEIVQKALAAQDYFLIQGPPGTGKTSNVLTQLVLELIGRGENVLVTAFTNQAVNEICKALDKNGFQEYIRLGRGGNGERSFESMVERFPKLDELHAEVMRSKVFVSTQATLLGRPDLFLLKTFHTVIVDEASQLLEPQLIGILSRCERFILIGDEKQLPAVVQQTEALSKTKSSYLHEIELSNLRESLFYRLLKNAEKKGWTDCYAMLTHHYRMHEVVAAFVNVHFYGNNLEIANPELQKALNPITPLNEADDFGKKLATSRAVFFPSKVEKGSKTNEGEARHLAKLACYIRENYERWYNEPFDETKHLGIITPFRAQIGKIRQILQGDFPNLLIDTVERFQGSERDIILISYAVRSARQLENLQAFTPDKSVDRKLNVALSRAKKHLVITGCEEILQQGKFFRELLGYCH